MTNEQAIKLLNSWLKESPEYDQKVWPPLKKLLIEQGIIKDEAISNKIREQQRITREFKKLHKEALRRKGITPHEL